MAPITLSRVASTTTAETTETILGPKESQKLLMQPVTHVEKQITPLRNAPLEPIQPIDHLPGTEDRNNRTKSNKETIKVIRMKLLKLQPKI